MENEFRWFRCKKCGKVLLRITDKSIVVNDIYCRNCKTYFQVEIYNGKIIKSEELPKEQ